MNELWAANYLYAMSLRDELRLEDAIQDYWKLHIDLQTPKFYGNSMMINGVSFTTVI